MEKLKVIGQKVYGLYGVSSYVIGTLVKVDGNKSSIQCKTALVTITSDDVYSERPENLEEFLK